MKIERNNKIDAFLERCRINCSDTRLNSFLDRKVTPGNEAYLRRALKQAGEHEFDGPEAGWPSLFLSVDTFEQTPYHRNITAKLALRENSLYTSAVFAGNRLFNLDEVQPDPERELKDWMKLRALDRDAETLVLTEGDTEWMLDMPSEAATNDPFASQAHGNVLLAGLGIGYVLYMTLRNPRVSHITVIEKNPAVIRRFETDLRPLFPDPERFKIIEGDALEFWTPDYLSRFDSIFADIWQSGEDGLFWMIRLLSQATVSEAQGWFWIENSCIVPLRTLLFLHFEELAFHTVREVSPDYQMLMNQVRRYFDSDSSYITDPSELKERMYSRRILRRIAGGRLCE